MNGPFDLYLLAAEHPWGLCFAVMLTSMIVGNRT